MCFGGRFVRKSVGNHDDAILLVLRTSLVLVLVTNLLVRNCECCANREQCQLCFHLNCSVLPYALRSPAAASAVDDFKDPCGLLKRRHPLSYPPLLGCRALVLTARHSNWLLSPPVACFVSLRDASFRCVECPRRSRAAACLAIGSRRAVTCRDVTFVCAANCVDLRRLLTAARLSV